MSKKERKLTKKEQERAVLFEQMTLKMEADGYVKKDLTVGIIYANFMALLLACPVVLIFGVVFIAFNPPTENFWVSLGESAGLFLIAYAVAVILLTVLHELIHGVTWAVFTEKRWRSVSFGIIWSALTPYCTCNEPLKRHEYILGSIAPTVLLGLIPMIISIFVGSEFLFLVGAVMYIGGGGDMTIIMKILSFRSSGSEVLYYDHPYEVGLVIFEK